MERVAMYLRKSRADLEAEARGEGETLTKHKKMLLEVAKQQKLNIVKIYEEIASGESLIHRPEMMKLLKEVEIGLYDAVLVMDMDRLGRGNMQEQGLILETFKRSRTKIITPRKVYDLEDEFDEEYSEFEAFMARKEYKIINRRLQRGRIRSIEEGNYIGTRPPYGYQIAEDKNGRFLIPHPDQAPVVRMIFEWYTHDDPDQRLGTNKIAHKLNELGIRTYTGKRWNDMLVLNIIKNEVYTGRIQWRKKVYKKPTDLSKKRETETRPRSEWIDVEGKHEAIISEQLFQKAQEILKTRYHVPYYHERGIRNPLAGLIRCDMCGGTMIYRPYGRQKPHLICYNAYCSNKSSRFEYIEARLLESLRDWLDQYKMQFDIADTPPQNNFKIELLEVTIKNHQQELKNLESQKLRLHDLLERGIYDEETFLERSKHIANRMTELREKIEQALQDLEKERLKEQAQVNIIPRVEHVLDLYPKLDDPKQKNALLKSILDHCTYRKEKHQRNDEFTLVIHPKL
ncbi:recombinase family protein [Thermoflavimicrobium dichotomicum]|uniref:Site-specific DNA recombinase n=1 Tax=Thermoflavimicrobium dichotomicum TaxID=46223 RepID=A0A1I3VH52_9BACL|nr:recombinase family protein [Thermoflavimicrobium dichotomicum]SFJ82404.1 Site-specific DNA recombinase [Thermoflavimicrobium dichotomicum]SFJ94323.1 Site-specific DNA recombinase [Thermoflavimicrobium dichotomicum]